MKHPVDKRYDRAMLLELRRRAKRHAIAGHLEHSREYRARVATSQLPEGRTVLLNDASGNFYFICGYSLVGGTDKAR